MCVCVCNYIHTPRSPRAVRFARFNVALNGLSHRVSVLQGDLYSALDKTEGLPPPLPRRPPLASHIRSARVSVLQGDQYSALDKTEGTALTPKRIHNP